MIGVCLVMAGCSKPETDTSSAPPAGATPQGVQDGGQPRTLELKSGKDRFK